MQAPRKLQYNKPYKSNPHLKILFVKTENII